MDGLWSDYQRGLNTLEQSCITFQNPTSQSAHKDAEQVILSFLRQNNPYQLCMFILEHSTSSLAHFHSISCMKDAILREWSALPSNFPSLLQDYLLNYAFRNQAIENPVKEKVYQTVAVILKRGWCSPDSDEVTPSLLQFRNSLFTKTDFTQFLHGDENTSPPISMLKMCVRILLSVIVEFSNSSKATSMGMTWEFHFRCFSSLQSTHLKSMFSMAITLLSYIIVKMGASTIENEVVLLLESVLSLLLEILEWRFEEKPTMLGYLSKISEEKGRGNVTLTPGHTWFDVLVGRQDLLQNLITIYPHIRAHSTLGHLVRSSLNQLASLSGGIFPDQSVKLNYLLGLIQVFTLFKYTTTPTPNSKNTCVGLRDVEEEEGFSNFILRLISTFKGAVIYTLPRETLTKFLHEILLFTIDTLQIMKSSSSFEGESLGEGGLGSSFDLVLEAWSVLIGQDEWRQSINSEIINILNNGTEANVINQLLQECSSHIYKSYVETRLEMAKKSLEEEDNEYDTSDNLVQTDAKQFNDQLIAISFLGRFCANTTTLVLTNALEEQIQQFNTPHPVSVFTFEETHWLILLCGNFLADEGIGETPLIPRSINSLSGVDNSVVTLITKIFHVLEIESKFITERGIASWSNLLSETLMWFLKRWCVTYLFPENERDLIIEHNLLQNYGVNGPQILEFILQKINMNLRVWQGEVSVQISTVELFSNLCRMRAPPKHVMNLPSWSKILEIHQQITTSQFTKTPLLSPVVQGKILHAFVNLGTNLTIESEVRGYFEMIVGPLNNSFFKVLHTPNFLQSFEVPHIKGGVIISLEQIKGIAQSLSIDSLYRSLIQGACVQFMGPIVELITVYKFHTDILELILEFFLEFSENQLDHLYTPDILPQYFQTLQQLYQKTTTVLPTLTQTKSSLAKTQLKELSKLILTLLRILASVANNSNSVYYTVNMILFGLSSILPHITQPILEFPKISQQYFFLISFAMHDNALSVITLSTDLYHSILKSLEYGISNFDVSISKTSLEALSDLCKCYFHQQTDPQIKLRDQGLLTHFMQVVLNLVLFEGSFQIDELIVPASSTLLGLMCCLANSYQQILHSIISKITSPNVQQRLTKEFEKLLSGVQMNLERKNREHFSDNLKPFLTEVRAFLMKK